MKTIFLYIPSAFLEAYTAMVLLSIQADLKALVVFSFVVGLVAVLTRDVLGLLGPHTIILFFTFVVASMAILKLRPIQAFLSRIISLFLVIIGEVLVTSNLLFLWKIEPQSTLESAPSHILAGWLANSILVVTCIAAIALGSRAWRFGERGSKV